MWSSGEVVITTVQCHFTKRGEVVITTVQCHSTKRGEVVITTVQCHSTKPELRFSAGSNPSRSVSEIRDG